jgi:hypothetical protein
MPTRVFFISSWCFFVRCFSGLIRMSGSIWQQRLPERLFNYDLLITVQVFTNWGLSYEEFHTSLRRTNIVILAGMLKVVYAEYGMLGYREC